MIRQAEVKDAEALVRMARAFHQATPLSRYDFHPLRAAEMALAAIQSPDALALVVDLDGPLGCLIGEVARYPLGGEILAREVVLWVDPDHRGRWAASLVRNFEAWARKRGAQSVYLSCFPDTPVMRLYQALGYEPAELHAVKDIAP